MDIFKNQRKKLVEEVRGQGIKDRKVLNAILKIPRHLFVPKELINQSYGNYPLSLDKGQTISQPYTAAIMLESLELKKGNKVLEIGTASGWDACLIAEIIKPGVVYTVEITPELVEFAKKNLKKLNIKNVTIIYGDGSQGYGEKAPYDKIILTAACPRIPQPLIEQLKENGIIVAPVGPKYGQKLVKCIKKNGKLSIQELGDFMFVPLKGKHSY